MSGLFARPYDGHATRANVQHRMMKTRSIKAEVQKSPASRSANGGAVIL